MILIVSFAVGAVASFLASLPPGIISLTVVDTTVHKHIKHGVLVALGAAFIEFFQCFVAVYFTSWFISNPYIEKAIDILTMPVLLFLGIYFIVKAMPGNRAKKSAPRRGGHNSLFKGMLVSSLNMIAIPFWIFWSSKFFAKEWIEHTWLGVGIFALGVSIGTFLALNVYGALTLKFHVTLRSINLWVSRVIGVLLLGLAIYDIVDFIMNGI